MAARARYETVRNLLELGATMHIIQKKPLSAPHEVHPKTGKLYTKIPVDVDPASK